MSKSFRCRAWSCTPLKEFTITADGVLPAVVKASERADFEDGLLPLERRIDVVGHGSYTAHTEVSRAYRVVALPVVKAAEKPARVFRRDKERPVRAMRTVTVKQIWGSK